MKPTFFFRNITWGVLLLLLVSSCKPRYIVAGQHYQQYKISAAAADTGVLNAYRPYKEQLEKAMDRVIGYCEQDMPKPGVEPESLMGNFFSDFLLAEGKKKNPSVSIAFTTKGGIRNGFLKGNIKVDDIFEAFPYENRLTLVEVDGAAILEMTKYIAAAGGHPVAGLTFNIKNDKTPEAIAITGKPLDMQKTYVVATYDYLADGGDNFPVLTKALKRTDYPDLLRELLIAYIEQLTTMGKHINVVKDGRITQH